MLRASRVVYVRCKLMSLHLEILDPIALSKYANNCFIRQDNYRPIIWPSFISNYRFMVFISVHMLTLRSRWMWDNWLKLRKQFCAYFHADLMIHKIMFLYQTLQSHTSLTRFHYQFSPFNQAFVIICDDFSAMFFLPSWELKRIPYGDSRYLWLAIFIQNLLWRWEILNGQPRNSRTLEI